ncbi:MAG: hypothetical protein RIQ46_983 [Pseudomonadota bacterium]
MRAARGRATSHAVSKGADDIAGATAAADAARDWAAVRKSADIQFAPLAESPPRPPPGWLKALGEFLQAVLEPVGRLLGLSWPVLQWILAGLAIVLVAWLGWRVLRPLLARQRRGEQAPEPEWTPDRQAAKALLDDADRLAAQGRYGEATHLLLQRSVDHIAEARPGWLEPASTAREIARLPMLPRAAAHAFAEIAGRVERSLFALRDLDAADWQAARAAYADFALADLKGAAR